MIFFKDWAEKKRKLDPSKIAGCNGICWWPLGDVMWLPVADSGVL